MSCNTHTQVSGGVRSEGVSALKKKKKKKGPISVVWTGNTRVVKQLVWLPISTVVTALISSYLTVLWAAASCQRCVLNTAAVYSVVTGSEQGPNWGVITIVSLTYHHGLYFIQLLHTLKDSVEFNYRDGFLICNCLLFFFSLFALHFAFLCFYC